MTDLEKLKKLNLHRTENEIEALTPDGNVLALTIPAYGVVTVKMIVKNQ